MKTDWNSMPTLSCGVDNVKMQIIVWLYVLGHQTCAVWIWFRYSDRFDFKRNSANRKSVENLKSTFTWLLFINDWTLLVLLCDIRQATVHQPQACEVVTRRVRRLSAAACHSSFKFHSLENQAFLEAPSATLQLQHHLFSEASERCYRRGYGLIVFGRQHLQHTGKLKTLSRMMLLSLLVLGGTYGGAGSSLGVWGQRIAAAVVAWIAMT